MVLNSSILRRLHKIVKLKKMTKYGMCMDTYHHAFPEFQIWTYMSEKQRFDTPWMFTYIISAQCFVSQNYGPYPGQTSSITSPVTTHEPFLVSFPFITIYGHGTTGKHRGPSGTSQGHRENTLTLSWTFVALCSFTRCVLLKHRYLQPFSRKA